MALYAIGDVQGCDAELGELLGKLKFSANRDSLWFVGDLVNRGPDSLKVLRRIRDLGDAATVILGNHDLHLLAVACGAARPRRDDTIAEVLAAPDRTSLIEWLQNRPLMHDDLKLNVCMVHAGLAPQWDLKLARQCAREFEKSLRRDPDGLLDRLYGDKPDRWDDALEGEQRLRFIVNCFTRLRYLDAEGRLALGAKGAPKKAQTLSLIPWFEAPDARWRGSRIVFGHWSTLGFFRNADVTGIDTGCVWGDRLTAVRLDDAAADPIQVACR
ncbi:MAG TPA: symmetrical bis(5'-nucleosyl)-tetraphosphatase [Steroidobacteraceae bacterium]|jgi:bis(5'-nucleosyl)-tetraphosphatase (symmetrical)|nr:symmetrical bis(5'-nucleosyl)-tetraphosphatase [Steroidobacteraceae bacterium]